MQRFLIQCVNGALLIVIVLGVPAITRVQLWSLQIGSAPILQLLMLWGLALAAMGNAAAGLIVFKGGKERKVCWQWAMVFSGLLAADYGLIHGWFNFNWLKRALLGLRNRLG